LPQIIDASGRIVSSSATGRPTGVVPSYLPGKNPYQEEFAKRYHLPLKGVLGGAETALPEFVRGTDTSASMTAEAGTGR